ncbi:MAG: prepilin-type N-terminal cleavage/methylation domain-containing protein [Candidatus Roizmanbacteria bacterium]|nr:prepilin-type N-terminal cleavage/methylation domain-containing protein [Candidatus Roizmanbacteria bacterium]
MGGKSRIAGFTLIEVFITFTILIVLLTLMNYTDILTYIQRSHDSVSKADLNKARSIFESFQKDHGRYPTVAEVTYDIQNDTSLAGKMCGKRYTDDILKEYSSELPCNSQSPAVDYVYFTYNNNQDFVLFTLLERPDDQAIQASGCSGGCSYFTNSDNPTDSLSTNYFNYAVYSSLDYLNCALDNQWYCQSVGGTNLCNTCSGRTSGPCFDPVVRKYCRPSWCEVQCN